MRRLSAQHRPAPGRAAVLGSTVFSRTRQERDLRTAGPFAPSVPTRGAAAQVAAARQLDAVLQQLRDDPTVVPRLPLLRSRLALWRYRRSRQTRERVAYSQSRPVQPPAIKQDTWLGGRLRQMLRGFSVTLRTQVRHEASFARKGFDERTTH